MLAPVEKLRGFQNRHPGFVKEVFYHLYSLLAQRNLKLEHCIRRICTDILRKHFLQKKLSCEGTASDAVWMTWYCFHCLHTYLPSKPRLQFFQENWHRILITPIWGNSKNNGFFPKSSQFNRVFHYFHHPFSLFLETPISGILRSAHVLQQSSPCQISLPTAPNSPQVS